MVVPYFMISSLCHAFVYPNIFHTINVSYSSPTLKCNAYSLIALTVRKSINRLLYFLPSIFKQIIHRQHIKEERNLRQHSYNYHINHIMLLLDDPSSSLPTRLSL